MFEHEIQVGEGWYRVEFELLWDQDWLVPEVKKVWEGGYLSKEWTREDALAWFYEDWRGGKVKLCL